jgi:pyruvate dehydrogenase E2 component (dihydrolipoamide acetyltransferase)
MDAVRNAGSAARSAGAGGIGWMEAGRHPLRGIRRVTAETMARSWSEIPHITGMDEVDATALLDTRRRLRDLATPGGERGAQPVSPLAILCLAVVQALRRYPLVNATLDAGAGTITVHPTVNLGVAVATGSGLVVPVIPEAERLGLAGLTDAIGRLAAAGRAGTLKPSDLRGGTFTVTNYGSLGGRFATPIIRPGESGIIGFGAIRPRPCVVGDRVEPRPMLPVVFSADHRLIDGDLATAFQEHVLASIREPLHLLMGA